MKFLECDLEEIIYKTYQEKPNELIRRGLYDLNGKMKRQLKIGNYGIADLITIERCEGFYYDVLRDIDVDGEKYALCDATINSKIIITVYELKKDKIGISAFLQAVRYTKGIQDYFDKRGLFKRIRIEYKIVLIGKEIDLSGSFCYLKDIFNNIEFFTYDYDFNGIYFTQSSYSLSQKGFKL